MKSFLFVIIVLTCGNAFAQKHRKSKNVFAFSYRLDAKEFMDSISYEIAVAEWNDDSVLVSCKPNANNVSGTILYSCNLLNGITESNDGSFRIKIAKNELNHTKLELTLQFEGYEETFIDAELYDYPDNFSVAVMVDTIFDPETPYVIINSLDPLSYERQKEIINCLPKRRKENQSCYDEKRIHIVIPI